MQARPVLNASCNNLQPKTHNQRIFRPELNATDGRSNRHYLQLNLQSSAANQDYLQLKRQSQPVV
jgi:hypothetical protein